VGGSGERPVEKRGGTDNENRNKKEMYSTYCIEKQNKVKGKVRSGYGRK
jgi:hypothetical protein